MLPARRIIDGACSELQGLPVTDLPKPGRSPFAEWTCPALIKSVRGSKTRDLLRKE